METDMLIERKKHSTLGILSFVIFIIICSIRLCLILNFSITSSNSRGDFLIKSFSVLLGLASLVGVILGIIGTVQKDQKKVFAIIGLVFNILVLLIISWEWISVGLGI